MPCFCLFFITIITDFRKKFDGAIFGVHLIEEEGRGKSEDVASKSWCVVGASKPVAVPVEERVRQGALHEFRYWDGGHLEFLYGYL